MESGKDKISFKVGEKATVTVKSADDNIPLDKVQATSSNGAIAKATVKELEVTITAEAVGEAIITLTNDKFEPLTIQVTVKDENGENPGPTPKDQDWSKVSMTLDREEIVIPVGAEPNQRIENRVHFKNLEEGIQAPSLTAISNLPQEFVKVSVEGDKILITPQQDLSGLAFTVTVGASELNIQNNVTFKVEGEAQKDVLPTPNSVPHNTPKPVKVGDDFTLYFPQELKHFIISSVEGSDSAVEAAADITGRKPGGDGKNGFVVTARHPGEAAFIVSAEGYNDTIIVITVIE